MRSSFVCFRSLEELTERATVRVVRCSEVEKMVPWMRQFEAVHPDRKGARCLEDRITGSHRLTFVLEYEGHHHHHEHLPLAYLLLSVSPYVASNMNAIFNDEWNSAEKRRFCNFYSITSLNTKGPLKGIPVGGITIHKAAELLRTKGIRGCLEDKHAQNELVNDVVDSNVEPQLYTMSPMPQLRHYLENKHMSLVKALDKEEHVDKEEVVALATKMVNEKKDYVAKFHIGNGARLAKIHWGADDSDLRMQQSFGIMCNYSYNKA